MLSGVLLGTGATKPSAERAPSAIYIVIGGDRLLLDCGQGTQRQLLKYGCDFFMDAIIISHHHTDHDHGITPYLESMNLMGRTLPLWIYSPEPKKVKTMIPSRMNYVVETRLAYPGLEYIVEKEGYRIIFYQAKHGTIPAVGVRLQSVIVPRYDRKKLLMFSLSERKQLFLTGEITVEGTVQRLVDFRLQDEPRFSLYYSGDSVWTKDLDNRVHKKGLIIHECTFVSPENLQQAKQRKHTHFNDVSVKQECILTHVSERTPHHKTAKYSRGFCKWAYDGLQFFNKIW